MVILVWEKKNVWDINVVPSQVIVSFLFIVPLDKLVQPKRLVNRPK